MTSTNSATTTANLPAVVRTLGDYILLDRSGSMASRWAETLSALNAYVTDLAGKPETRDSKVTLATFDTQRGGLAFDVIRKGVPTTSYKPVHDNEATPRGFTPLYDAIGRIVTLAEEDAPTNAVIVVITDGDENNSRELDKSAAKAALDRCRAKGWQVIFLGADFDAMKQSASVGTQSDQTLTMKKGHYRAAAFGLAESRALYASGANASMSFSADDRKRAGGA